MILIDESAPRWMQELERFRPIKNLIFLHGNILDLVSYPEQEDGVTHWVSGDTIDGFLRNYLVEQGYAVVGVLDPLTGLAFPGDRDRKMAKTYDALLEGQAAPAQNAPSASPPARQPGAGNAPTRAGGQQEDHRIESDIAAMSRLMANPKAPCAFVINLASRLLSSPGYPNEREHRMLTHLLKGSWTGTELKGTGNGTLNNLIILVCDKLNDLPPFLYIENPRARAIQVDKPNHADRKQFFEKNYGVFHGAALQEPSAQTRESLAARFSFLTEGMANHELQSLLDLSNQDKIGVEALDALVNRYKFGVTKSEWDSADLRRRLRDAETIVRTRVKGQDEAVARITDLVKRASLGLAAGDAGRSHRPRGVLFFAGPTGVGKTETAKALAQVLFGNEDRMLRFDMSEYAAEHADARLLGSPPGYIGYETGGQLTSQVKERPFSVLLFDEIEKAHPRIFDKFLQILDDGRLTDGKGDTVYFSESVIIFTSNLGTEALDSGQNGPTTPVQRVSRRSPYGQVRDTILEAIKWHFNERLGRPEILNRFGDNFVVFDYIRPPVHEEIVDHMLGQVKSALRALRGIELTDGPAVRKTLVSLAEERLDHGGRGIRNVIDRVLVDPLARWLFDQPAPGEGHRLEGLEIVRILDHGESRPQRFELEATPRYAPNGPATR